MHLFTEWLKRIYLESNALITIDISAYAKMMENQLSKIIQSEKEYRHEAEQFKITPEFRQELISLTVGYPRQAQLLTMLSSQNYELVGVAIRNVFNWIRSLPTDQQFSTRGILRKLWTFHDSLDKNPTSEDGYRNELSTLLAQTENNMGIVHQNISQAISRIDKWNGSPIGIKPSPSYDMNTPAWSPADSAYVTVGKENAGFSYFALGDKIEIDDVVEGGEQDIFSSDLEQADYFNLINELRDPGRKRSKILTLYTARPKKDREQFSHATELPNNIFLTSTFDHAVGLATDYRDRDVYKVRIDSKYLTQTLFGDEKQYQVTVAHAPLKSIQLLWSGD